jgi:flagellar hook-length control protein FliK
MSPVLSQVVPSAGVDRKAQLPVKNEASFSQHLERKLRSEKAEKKNLLGARDTKPAKPSKKTDGAVTTDETQSAQAEEKSLLGAQGAKLPKAINKTDADSTDETPVTVEAVLQQLMLTLKDMADKPVAGAEAGQWTFQLKDMGLLEKLAAQAGMDEAGLAALKNQMKEQGGLPLADLFAALEKNFKDLGTATKVTVPETYLPLLETLLSRIGVAPEAIQQLDAKGVDGLDQLDLKAFLKGLQATPTPDKGQDVPAAPCVLSDWELEQLSAMLTEAGVSSDKIALMFPEKTPGWQKALAGATSVQADTPVTMSLDRLKDLLQQAVAAVDEARPKADPPGFFTELETVISQAGFKSSDVGFSPVVQGTMKAAYEELQKLVDQGKGRAEKYLEITAQNDAIDKQWQTSDGKEVEAFVAGQESDLLSGDTATGDPKDALSLVADDSGGTATKNTTFAPVEINTPQQAPTEPAMKAQPLPRFHLSPELQQLTVEQISQSVLRGLKNNEHHITLTLYPKELGEVKVDLQVRGSQLSASFVMENQKVKEAMESNMEEFKDNLERRGFNLGAMSVSVGHENHSNESGQQFVAAWEQMRANQQSRENSVVPSASPLEFMANDQATLRQGGISLFV